MVEIRNIFFAFGLGLLCACSNLAKALGADSVIVGSANCASSCDNPLRSKVCDFPDLHLASLESGVGGPSKYSTPLLSLDVFKINAGRLGWSDSTIDLLERSVGIVACFNSAGEKVGEGTGYLLEGGTKIFTNVHIPFINDGGSPTAKRGSKCTFSINKTNFVSDLKIDINSLYLGWDGELDEDSEYWNDVGVFELKKKSENNVKGLKFLSRPLKVDERVAVVSGMDPRLSNNSMVLQTCEINGIRSATADYMAQVKTDCRGDAGLSGSVLLAENGGEVMIGGILTSTERLADRQNAAFAVTNLDDGSPFRSIVNGNMQR